MAKCYFELRKQSARGTDSIAADMMRHLHARQHLGKAVIVCEQPFGLLAASRKQWLKLSRSIQKQRASTLNADKILKHTHTITRMQHMRFSARTPLEDPEADVYLLDEASCTTMPIHCYSVYLTYPVAVSHAANIVGQLPSEALIIDYCRDIAWAKLGLQSKVVLEEQVASEWAKVRQFLQSYNIDATHLVSGQLQNVEAMDNALDTLLDVSHQFLRIAEEFQRTLELARPVRIERPIRYEYDATLLLAYRVQALSPGIFTQRFLETYNEDDTFFLYDHTQKRFVGSGELLADAIARHLTAGRGHLARALQFTYA